MRKIILITMAAIFAVGVMAQQKMRVWKNNSLAYEEDVTQIDSITFFNDSPIEQSKTEYMWLEAKEEFLINWNNNYCNIDYSFDKVNWTTAVATSSDYMETFTVVPADTKIYLRGVNGANNSFWGSDWWGCIRTTTEYLYKNSKDAFAPDFHHIDIDMSCGGNILSLVFGDEFVEHANDVVNSTLSRICMRLLVADASLLYINPAAYGTNTAWRSSNGNQWGLFEWCGNLKKGPYIKYLKTSTFNDCKLLTDIYYIGDGSEITNTPAGSGFDEPEGGAIWFNDATSSEVETLTIHVKPGVSIPYKPANAVVVEDLE